MKKIIPLLIMSFINSAASSVLDEKGKFVKRLPSLSSLNVPLDGSEKYSYDCSNNAWLKTAKTTDEIVKEEENKDYTFFDTKPTDSTAIIKSAAIDNSTLKLKFHSFEVYEEFKGPIVSNVWKRHYEGKPGTTVLGTGLLIGLPLLFAPINTVKGAFGCTDYATRTKEVDINKSIQTGNVRWDRVQTKQTIRVVGFDKVYDYEVDAPASPDEITTVDLGKAIAESDVSNLSNLIISCTTCDSKLSKLNPDISVVVSEHKFSYDFSPIKFQEEERERIRIEQEEIQRNKLIRNEQLSRQLVDDMVGRWNSHENCLNKSMDQLGTFYEKSNDQIMIRRIVNIDKRTNLLTYTSESKYSKVEYIDNDKFLFESTLTSSITGKKYQIISETWIKDGVQRLLNSTVDGKVVVRDGVDLSSNKEVQFSTKCEHPKIIAERRAIEKAEEEGRRKAEQEERERRRKMEQEEKDRKLQKEKRDQMFKL